MAVRARRLAEVWQARVGAASGAGLTTITVDEAGVFVAAVVEMHECVAPFMLVVELRCGDLAPPRAVVVEGGRVLGGRRGRKTSHVGVMLVACTRCNSIHCDGDVDSGGLAVDGADMPFVEMIWDVAVLGERDTVATGTG